MTARGAGFMAGGFVVASLWTAVNGWLAAFAYGTSTVVGACVYSNRWPWRL